LAEAPLSSSFITTTSSRGRTKCAAAGRNAPMANGGSRGTSGAESAATGQFSPSPDAAPAHGEDGIATMLHSSRATTQCNNLMIMESPKPVGTKFRVSPVEFNSQHPASLD